MPESSRQLTDADIIALGKKVAHEIDARSPEELYDQRTQDEIVLGMVVTKDAMLSEDVIALERRTPYDGSTA